MPRMTMIAAHENAATSIDWEQNDLYRFFAFVFAPPTRECFDLLSQPSLPEALRILWKQLECEGEFPGFEWFASYEQYESAYIALFDVGMPEPPVPLFESAHDKTHPAQEIALENTYFYEVLGLKSDPGRAVPDLPCHPVGVPSRSPLHLRTHIRREHCHFACTG